MAKNVNTKDSIKQPNFEDIAKTSGKSDAQLESEMAKGRDLGKNKKITVETIYRTVYGNPMKFTFCNIKFEIPLGQEVTVPARVAEHIQKLKNNAVIQKGNKIPSPEESAF